MRGRVKSIVVGVLTIGTLVWSGLPAQPTSAQQANARPYAGQTIVFDAQFHNSVDALKPYLPQFEKQTGIHVVVNEYPYPDIINAQQIALAGNHASYDVGMADPLYLLSWYRAGWVTPLTDLVKQANASVLNLSDFLKPAMGQMRDPKTGVLFGLPIYVETTNLMYRKDLFQQHHLNPPQTLDEMAKDAKILDDPHHQVYGIVLRGLRGNGLNIYIWTGIYRSMGGTFFDAKGNPTVSDAAGVNATNYYANILNQSGPPGPSNVGWEQALSLMEQGHAAMMIDASVFAGSLESTTQSKVVGKVGYAEVPAGPAGRFPSLAAWGMYIPKGDKHTGAAMQFIQWALSRPVQLESAITGSRSDVTRTSVWNEPAFQAMSIKWTGWNQVTLKSIQDASPDYRPRISNWPAVGDVLGEAVSEVTSGQSSASAALTQANKKIADLMKHAQ